ncbi:hypothetical protein ACFV30_00010 [Streptomyces sp. NPDC059752]|uniref:hypothetical protein n=1 Tax=unclassified Streptomyces TaxID=2593676 RepID=UPI003652993B
MRVPSGAEVAGAAVALALLVVPRLVGFLIGVADVMGVRRMVAGGEGDGRVTLGFDVLLVLAVPVEPDGERVHLAHRCAERPVAEA